MNEQNNERYVREPERYLCERPVFEVARMDQAELDLMRFDTLQEAILEAKKRANRLDARAKEDGVMSKEATLLGDDVVIPYVDYNDAIGSVAITMEKAGDVKGRMPDVHGSFYGFTGYALKTEYDGRYRPMLGYSVVLREIIAITFHGHMIASGPVDSTFVTFLDDELDI